MILVYFNKSTVNYMDNILNTEEFRLLEMIITSLSTQKDGRNRMEKIKTFKSVLADKDAPMSDKQVARRKLKEYLILYKYNGFCTTQQ